LELRDQLRREADDLDRRVNRLVEAADRERVRRLATDLSTVWHAPTTTMVDRKALMRFLVNRVYLDGVTEAGQLRIEVEWHTGARTAVTVPRPPIGANAPKAPVEAVNRIRDLRLKHTYGAIAKQLNSAGLRTAKGLPFDHRSVGYVIRSRHWNRDK
jgi:hypothetical protein